MFRLSILPALIVLLALAGLSCGDGDQGAATPTATPTVTPVTTPSPTSTPFTPGSGPIHISPPENRREFLDQFADKEIVKQHCTYDAAVGSADCGDKGLYALDPLLPADGEVACDVFLVEGEPVAVSCATATAAILYASP
ncbi:MAG: hypothetical protein A2Z17_07250 [Gammaproteobacteria bacterium RBG_16_66_13]|nr:MAG: hypothetical protein A2Z17_07250 [Gammaproteobacteria bacterium RBG_16_66_13]